MQKSTAKQILEFVKSLSCPDIAFRVMTHVYLNIDVGELAEPEIFNVIVDHAEDFALGKIKMPGFEPNGKDLDKICNYGAMMIFKEISEYNKGVENEL